MPAMDSDILDRWRDMVMVDLEGTTVGTISEFYLDRETGQPTWALVSTGLFGARQTFVPLTQATRQADEIRVPYPKALIREAPRIEPDGQLSPDEEATLFTHYGLDYWGGDGPSGPGVVDQERPGPVEPRAERDASPGPGGDPGVAVTRSEEELRVATERQPRARVRLRKYVVTEDVTTTVPVRREEVRLEDVPLGPGAPAADDADPADEHEVVLHEERPVVETRTVPTERVRLAKDTVREEREVAEELRKEQVEVEEQDPGPR
jgi:uncharacterized protein (TIGR02271 family)